MDLKNYCCRGRVTHICVGKLTIIGSDKGLSPGRRQAIIQTNDGILLFVNLTLRNKFQWNLKRNLYIFIQENAFETVVYEMASILSRPQCINVPWANVHDQVHQASTSPEIVVMLTIGAASGDTMGLLPDTENCRCACAGNAGNVFPATGGKRSRHASRQVRDARAMMHAGIAN